MHKLRSHARPQAAVEAACSSDFMYYRFSITAVDPRNVRRMTTEVLVAGLTFSVTFPVVVALLITWSSNFKEGPDIDAQD